LQPTKLQFGDGIRHRDAHRLRQLTDADEVVREQGGHAVDQIVVDPRPDLRHRLVAFVMRHGAGLGREDRHVNAPFAQGLQLILLDAFAHLVVADCGEHRRRSRALAEHVKLRVAVVL